MGAGQEVLRFLHQRQVQETPHGRLRPQPQYNLQINYVSRIDRFVSKATCFMKYQIWLLVVSDDYRGKKL